jgi:hypothetical protein
MGVAVEDLEMWRLYRGDELVGEIYDTGVWDMFWIEGRFLPRGSFESDLRALFVDASEGLASGDLERGVRASRTILESLSMTDPQALSVSLFNIVIEADRARFRLK